MEEMRKRQKRGGSGRQARSITRDPEAWKRAWREAKASSPVNRREHRGQGAELERWNQRASSYAEHTESEESRARRREILRWIEEAGALRPGCRVLDIGAGPGNFAISMARTAAEVVAIEPAGEMVSILEQRLAEEKITNVRIVGKTWEEADLGTEAWLGAFDLVFASMSPGVSRPEMLEKMLSVSRAFCYLSGWSGDSWGKWGPVQRELWPLIFSEELGDYPSDILYSFGMLYAMGYRPELRFLQPRIHLEMDSEEAIRGLIEHFNRYVEVDGTVRRIITDYVGNNSRSGLFAKQGISCQGFMLWRVLQ
jgi:protein-L-isoaspartate O-methyltransferase